MKTQPYTATGGPAPFINEGAYQKEINNKPINMKTLYLNDNAVLLHDNTAATTERPVCPNRTVKNHNRALFLWLSFMLLVILPGMALADDTGWLSPTVTKAELNVDAQDNVFSTDNNRATWDDRNDWADYGNFNIDIPAGSTIDGIEIRAEGYRTASDQRELDILLSWNNGISRTSAKRLPINPHCRGDGLKMLKFGQNEPFFNYFGDVLFATY